MFSHDAAQMTMPSLNQWKDENTEINRNIFMTKSHGKNVAGQGLNQPPLIQLGNLFEYEPRHDRIYYHYRNDPKFSDR